MKRIDSYSSSNEQYLAEGTYFYILDLGNR
jgi:hypothetical protein